MNGLSIILLVVVSLFGVSWYGTKDDISCVVSGAEIDSINGYYTAFGGIYIRKGYQISSNPDVFEILNLRRFMSHETSTISFSKHMWTIDTDLKKNIVYLNEPANPEKYLYSPPTDNWTQGEHKTPSKLVIKNCIGSLQDSPPINHEFSNIGQLLAIPVTTSLLLLIVGFAYYLWAYRIDTKLVTYSYDAIVNRGEYYRIITSTLAHTELFHLGFNTMGLYSMGLSLEGAEYNSIVYLYDTVNLIFFCIFIETFVLYLITRTGRTDFIQNESLGYSGVLFAWMVAYSIRMPKFCPIFIFPTVCLTTFHLPIPDLISHVFTTASGLSLPINIGVFVALIVTKIIVPRSSFLGHLSGILIGYPLAWNLLNWITPPVSVSLLTLCYVAKENLNIASIPSYSDHSGDLADFVSAKSLWNYRVFTAVSVVLVVLEGYSVLAFSWFQVLTRGVSVVLLVVCVYARKIEFLSSLNAVHELCVKLMLCLVVNIISLLLYDVCTLGATLSSHSLLVGSGLSSSTLQYHTVYMIILIICEMICIVSIMLCVYDMPAVGDRLKSVRLDRVAVEKDLESLGVMRILRGGVALSAFSGQGNRLSSSQPATSGSGNVESGLAMQPMPVSGMHLGGAGSSASSAGGSGGRGAYANLNQLGGRMSPGGRKMEV